MSLNKEKSKCCNKRKVCTITHDHDIISCKYVCFNCLSPFIPTSDTNNVANEEEECKHEPMPYHFEGQPEHSMCGKCFKILEDLVKQDTTDWKSDLRTRFLEKNSPEFTSNELIDFIESVRQKAQQEAEAKTRLEISELISKKFVQIQNTTVLDLLEELQKEILSGLSNQ